MMTFIWAIGPYICDVGEEGKGEFTEFKTFLDNVEG